MAIITQKHMEELFKAQEQLRKWNKLTVTLLAGKGWGKTTFAASLPGAFLIETDFNGAKFVDPSVPVQYCRRWDYYPLRQKTESKAEFQKRLTEEMLEGNIGFIQIAEYALENLPEDSIIVIDTVEQLYLNMESDYCRKHNVPMLPDDFQRTNRMLKRQFAEVFKALCGKFGVIVTSHVREDEVKTRTENYTKIRPNVTKIIWDTIAPASDIIFYGKIIEKRSKKTGKIITKRVLSGELMEEYFDSGGRVIVDDITIKENNPSEYIEKVTEAINRKMKSFKERKPHE